MPSKVYLETSIISYLTARPSRDVVVAGHQQTTRDWWETQRQRFVVVASQLVVQEARAGDADAAQQRLALLTTVELLSTTETALELAQFYSRNGPFPPKQQPMLYTLPLPSPMAWSTC